MGACTFTQHQSGTDVQRAFAEATREAAYEHGHGGYSGTLAEKHSYTVITHTPMSEADAQELADQLISNDDPRISDKWGPAGAIPTKSTTASNTRTVEVVVETDDDERNLRVLADLAKAKVRLRKGESVIATNIVSSQTIKSKVDVAATEGAMVTRYYVTDSYGHKRSGGHETVASARRQMVELLSNPSPYATWGEGLEVRGEITRAGGQALVTGVRRVVKQRHVLNVTVGKVSSSDKITGWLFFGWASS